MELKATICDLLLGEHEDSKLKDLFLGEVKEGQNCNDWIQSNGKKVTPFIISLILAVFFNVCSF